MHLAIITVASQIILMHVRIQTTEGILDFGLSSEQHYKDNSNSLRVLAVMCHGIKTEDGCEIVDFDRDPWVSLKVCT